MAIAKADITEGYYWARNKHRALVVVQVRLALTFEPDETTTLEVLQHEWEFSEPIDGFDFLARIEPPEGV